MDFLTCTATALGGAAVSAVVSGFAVFLVMMRKSRRASGHGDVAVHDAAESSAHGLLFFGKDEKFARANSQAYAFLPILGDRQKGPATLGELLDYLYDHAIDCDESLISAVDRSNGSSPLQQGFREVLPWGRNRFCLVQVQKIESGGAVVIVSDITHQKEHEEDVQRLLRLNRELVAAVEASTSGIIISDPKLAENPIIFANEAFSAILGLPLKDIAGTDWHFVLDAMGCLEVYGRLTEAISQKRVLDTELYIDGQSGKWYNLRISPVFDRHGKLDLLIAIQTDITKLKTREAEFFQAQKLEALGQLAGGVAHDFNNVLSIIDGYARMVSKELRKLDNRKLDDYMERIKQAASRGAGLTRQLLTFGRHKIVAESAVEVGHFVADMKPMLLPLTDTMIDLELIVPEEKIYIDCSPNELSQVIMNLVINARDAMPEGGTVTLEVARIEKAALPAVVPEDVQDREFVRLAVRDTGTGMDQKTMEKIFDPFFTTKAQGKGTGLGLSVVYGLIRQMEGFIDVRSALGEGTSMDIYFPLTDKRPQARSISEDEGTGALRFEGFTAVVAEDEPDILEIVSSLLEGMGMNVLKASNGNEALLRQEDHEGRIDFLITDVMMPGLDGVKLAELFQSLRPETFVVFMSGYPAAGQMAPVELPQGAYFMAKPIDYEKLAALLHEYAMAENKAGFHGSEAASAAYHWRAGNTG